ncbi:AIG1-like protein [Cynara cardunculus var. scolymus]|uniref:AIG1-like protein n=1 Tax=Cynara cardunculus var. scolymus TaxID=59895 RepID=A0A118K724_CYNCS|nr:AIG1-like protein [Cynara cardunculus var. scolymus]
MISYSTSQYIRLGFSHCTTIAFISIAPISGLFDSSVDYETIRKEIVRCIKMVVDGIHAILLVYSVCHRFSDEEKAAISVLQDLFGKKICDYMIVVFTCGDELELDYKTLEDFICKCPQALKTARLKFERNVETAIKKVEGGVDRLREELKEAKTMEEKWKQSSSSCVIL